MVVAPSVVNKVAPSGNGGHTFEFGGAFLSVQPRAGSELDQRGVQMPQTFKAVSLGRRYRDRVSEFVSLAGCTTTCGAHRSGREGVIAATNAIGQIEKQHQSRNGCIRSCERCRSDA